MQAQRRAARLQAGLAAASTISPSSPVYSSKRIVRRISYTAPHDGSSSSSSSPDSLYSKDSPTLPDPSFEYDGEEQVEQHDEAEYESLMAESAGWQTPAWGTWPEVGGNGADWTPSPTHHSPSGGTIISISPAGSLNRRGSRGSPSVFRSGGTGKSHTPSEDGRRGSDPSLLGFNLNSPDRRRYLPSRRRSSVLSNGSVIDPVEDARLRNIASMSMLRRRFSEVVDVQGSEEPEQQDTFVARRIMSQWSPYSDASELDDDDDTSEIHTAPYVPTPPVRHAIPSVLSNFPLASVASDPDYADTPSEILSGASSPISPENAPRTIPRIPRPPPPRTFATPPPPDQPSRLLRNKARPTLARAISGYQFPPREDVVPSGTAIPRPGLHRAISTPFFSASATGRNAANAMSARADASFPASRPAPLGESPLRASLRRQSIVSDGSRRGSVESRRGSIDSRRPSLSAQMTDRRFSVVRDRDNDLRRLSMDRSLANEVRRMSVEGGRRLSDGRKMSMDGRQLGNLRMSEGRRTSVDKSFIPVRESRRPSVVSVRGMSQALEDRRRSSATSRKSSVVSVSEYGYLAPQIVIDAAPSLPELPEPSPGFRRRAAPPSIILPDFSFPFHSPASSILSASRALPTPIPEVITPRFHPLDSFLGHVPPPPSSAGSHSPLPMDAEAMTTPTLASSSRSSNIMDRGRPLSPPEFRESFLPRFRGPTAFSPKTSPKASPKESVTEVASIPAPIQVDPLYAPLPMEEPRSSTPGGSRVSRKAVPRISEEEMELEEKKDKSMRRRSRRGAVGTLESSSALAREVARILESSTPSPPAPKSAPLPPVSSSSAHRRAVSSATAGQFNQRPGMPRRQLTMPTPLESAADMAIRKSHVVFEESTWRTPSHLLSPSADESGRPPLSHRPSSRAQSTHSPAQSSSSHVSQAPSPRARGDIEQIPPPTQAQIAEKVARKRASVTFSEQTHTISRPSVSRAASFTRFFKTRPVSLSGPPPGSSVSKPIRPSLRPASSDIGAIGHVWKE